MNNLQKETPSLPRRILDAAGRWIHIPVNMILVFCLVAGSLYMQIVAHQHEVNRGLILAFCAAFSAASVILYSWEHSGAVELALGVTCGAVSLLAYNAVSGSVKAYLANILYCYGAISNRFSMMDKDDNATLCFILLALLGSMLTAFYLMQSGPVLLALALPAVSLVITIARYWDLCEPAVVITVLCAVAVVAMTHRIRRIDTVAAGKQSLIVSVPTIAVIIVLALLINPEGYVLPDWGQRAREQTDNVLTNVFGIVQKPEENQYVGSTEVFRTKINIDDLGPRLEDKRQVMQVYSENSEVIYLRAFSYIGYSEGTWRHETPAQAKELSGALANPLSVHENEIKANIRGRIMIKTDEVDSMIFLPYTVAQIPTGASCYGDSYVRNTDQIKEYTLTYGRISAVNQENNREYERLVYDYYREIPEETAAALRAIAVENGIITAEEAEAGYPKDAADAVDRVVELVKNCAEYDTDPLPMPEEKDFPVWFLTEAESGYCTHFASTATLMLRAIGVPARMTSGFAVKTEAYEWTKVLGENMYVWVEYYNTKTGGWIVKKPTPSIKSEVSASDVIDYTEVTIVSGTDADVVSDTDEVTQPAATVTTATTAADAPTTTAAATTTTTAATTTTTAATTTTVAATTTTTAATSVTEPSVLTPETEPQIGKDGGSDGSAGITVLLSVIALPVLAWMVLLFVRMSINKKRLRSFTEGTANERAAAMAEYLQLLKEAGGGSWSTPVRNILLKAQFSQHELSARELEQVKESVAQSLEAVKINSNPLTDFVNRYIRHLY